MSSQENMLARVFPRDSNDDGKPNLAVGIFFAILGSSLMIAKFALLIYQEEQEEEDIRQRNQRLVEIPVQNSAPHIPTSSSPSNESWSWEHDRDGNPVSVAHNFSSSNTAGSEREYGVPIFEHVVRDMQFGPVEDRPGIREYQVVYRKASPAQSARWRAKMESLRSADCPFPELLYPPDPPSLGRVVEGYDLFLDAMYQLRLARSLHFNSANREPDSSTTNISSPDDSSSSSMLASNSISSPVSDSTQHSESSVTSPPRSTTPPPVYETTHSYARRADDNGFEIDLELGISSSEGNGIDDDGENMASEPPRASSVPESNGNNIQEEPEADILPHYDNERDVLPMYAE